MKSPHFNYLVLLAVASSAVMISALTAPVLNLTNYTLSLGSECSTNCLLENTSPTSCVNSTKNISCTCKQDMPAKPLPICLAESCKDHDTNYCHNKSYLSRFRTIRIALIVLGFTAVFLRLYAQWEKSIFYADDYLMVVLLMTLIPYSILTMLQDGFGRNAYDMEPKKVTSLVKLLTIGGVFHIFIITLSKLSMLLFYIRIFPTRTFKILSLVLAASIFVTLLIVFGLGCTECLPMKYNWIIWEGEWRAEAHCRNPYVLAIGYSVVNLVQEILVLVLPLPYVICLRIETKKKISLTLLFSCGILTCAISIVRITTLKTFTRSSNPTFDYADMLLWSLIEVYMNAVVPNLLGIFTFVSLKLCRLFGGVANEVNIHAQNSFFRNRALREQQDVEARDIDLDTETPPTIINTVLDDRNVTAIVLEENLFNKSVEVDVGNS